MSLLSIEFKAKLKMFRLGSTGFPKINMNPQVDNLTVLLGKPLDLVCNAYARTPPNVKWLKDGLEPVRDELNERVHTTSSGG